MIDTGSDLIVVLEFNVILCPSLGIVVKANQVLFFCFELITPDTETADVHRSLGNNTTKLNKKNIFTINDLLNIHTLSSLTADNFCLFN